MEFLLAALIFIESGGDPNVIGTHGERGPLQIKRVYWDDACRQLRAEGVPTGQLPRYDEQVRDVATSKRIVQAYWRRYCPQALRDGKWEVLARVHNGGPAGHRKAATAAYWQRVSNRMKAATVAPAKSPATSVSSAKRSGEVVRPAKSRATASLSKDRPGKTSAAPLGLILSIGHYSGG